MAIYRQMPPPILGNQSFDPLADHPSFADDRPLSERIASLNDGLRECHRLLDDMEGLPRAAENDAPCIISANQLTVQANGALEHLVKRLNQVCRLVGTL